MPLLRRDGHRLERRPEKAGQLARDRDRDLGRGLVVFRQASEAPTQALLRLVRNRDHPARLAFASARERHADARPMLIVPRRFNQQPADQRVARSRDAAAAMLLAAGVLARDEPQKRHQGPRRGEPPEVVQLRQDQDRRQRIDAAEAPQPADPFLYGSVSAIVASCASNSIRRASV